MRRDAPCGAIFLPTTSRGTVMTSTITTSPLAGAPHVLHAIAAALNLSSHSVANVQFQGTGALPSAFAVSDLAVGSVAAAGASVADWVALRKGSAAAVEVDRRLCSLWFGGTVRPLGWALPPAWDAIAGDYATADGWIRLHTNAPQHRTAALAALGFTQGGLLIKRPSAEP